MIVSIRWHRELREGKYEGKYEQVADVTGDDEFRAARPFVVTIRPSALVRTGPLD